MKFAIQYIFVSYLKQVTCLSPESIWALIGNAGPEVTSRSGRPYCMKLAVAPSWHTSITPVELPGHTRGLRLWLIRWRAWLTAWSSGTRHLDADKRPAEHVTRDNNHRYNDDIQSVAVSADIAVGKGSPFSTMCNRSKSIGFLRYLFFVESCHLTDNRNEPRSRLLQSPGFYKGPITLERFESAYGPSHIREDYIFSALVSRYCMFVLC